MQRGIMQDPYDLGYTHGFNGEPKQLPKGYSARDYYLAGYYKGEMDNDKQIAQSERATHG